MDSIEARKNMILSHMPKYNRFGDKISTEELRDKMYCNSIFVFISPYSVYNKINSSKYKFRNNDDEWIFTYYNGWFFLINLRLREVYEVYDRKCMDRIFNI